MKKIFTLLGGMLLASSLSVNAMEVEVSIYDDDTDKAAGDSYVTNLTKDSDGNFVLENFLGTIKSPVTLSFKFEKPSEINGYSGITVTSDYYIYDEKYADLFYLGKDEDNAPDMFINNYNNGGKRLWFCNPYIYNTARYTYVMALDKDEYGYDYYANICLSADYVYDYAISNYLNDTPYFDICFYFNDPSEANQEAYDDVIKTAYGLLEEYDAAITQIGNVNPDFDTSEWASIIVGGQDGSTGLHGIISGAKQALASANYDLLKFNYPFSEEAAEEYRGYIITMKNEAFADYNQVAYDEVRARIDEVETEYSSAVKAIKEIDTEFDPSQNEWESIIEGAINEAKRGASQALAAAKEDGALFDSKFDPEEIENSIMQMKMVNREAYNQGACKIAIANLDALDADYKYAVEAIKLGTKDGDPEFSEEDWGEIPGMIDQYKNAATQALDAADEDGGLFNALGTEGIEQYILSMKLNYRAAYNLGAYNMVAAEIKDVDNQYKAAWENINAQYPRFFVVTGWDDIMENAINGAMQGAEWEYFKATNYELDEEDMENWGQGLFNFLFSKTDIENMIAEMEKQVPNFVAYQDVLTQIEALEKEYNDAVAQIKEENPDFDLEGGDWTEIETKLESAKEAAKVAFDNANEDGDEFFFPFSAEDYEAMIEEMKLAPLKAENQKAYEIVLAEIEAVEAEYEEAIKEIASEYPDFDLAKWKEIIGGKLEEEKTGAEQALYSANEDAKEYNFLFDADTIEGMIDEMKNSAKTTGISNIEAEVAAGNAKIFTLDGKSHNALVKGQVNVIVKKNSTMRVMVNK